MQWEFDSFLPNIEAIEKSIIDEKQMIKAAIVISFQLLSKLMIFIAFPTADQLFLTKTIVIAAMAANPKTRLIISQKSILSLKAIRARTMQIIGQEQKIMDIEPIFKYCRENQQVNVARNITNPSMIEINLSANVISFILTFSDFILTIFKINKHTALPSKKAEYPQMFKKEFSPSILQSVFKFSPKRLKVSYFPRKLKFKLLLLNFNLLLFYFRLILAALIKIC
ncbi:UNKNOWN [Stylonychia lemnae]|uniref:Uncharacterized protein n=1 Tax=Stylonychia lemnae TaxID=5949 RepID=A0A078ACM1_STYLE|nr:UNKNOWN [Stylonychia lemnae]|eukprot:CDW79332.1 UNKNOWN [Stylonychia lemnae]